MKRYTRLLAALAAAGLGLSTILSANAANTAAGYAGAAQRSDDRMQAKAVSGAINEMLIDEMLSSGSFSEGEAIAVVRGSTEPAVSDSSELLMHLSSDAVKSAIETEIRNGSPSAGLARQRMEEDPQLMKEDEFTIWLVSDPGKTTKELLEELYEDPNVVSAEPNYLAYAAEEPDSEELKSGEASTEAAGEAAAETVAEEEPVSEESSAVTQQDSANPSDLSEMQWDLADTSDIYTTPLSPTGGYWLGVPGWTEGRRDENAPANASGTICIMDTGIDTDHPDLQGVLYEFSEEQQAKYGCGQYGFNASGDERPETEQKAVSSHGTHVAGIIAANWDGDGISGIAHGVKIFSVNVFGGTGSVMEMHSVLKGFKFLTDVAQEVNLKAVNCSWGTVQPQFSLSAAIEELGRKGVNIVIASGNRYLDLDETIDLGSQTHSEYAIVVNAASADGSMTDFSCWGQDSTDVFAPGGSIIASVPGIVQVGESRDPDVYEDHTHFYPEASEKSGLLSEIERFDSDTQGVLFFDANPAMDENARPIGEINGQNGYDDKHSMALRLAALPKEEPSSYGVYRAVNGYAYMAIPVTSAQDARWIGVKTAMTDAYKPVGAIDSITCRDESGKPVELDIACAGTLKKGLSSSASYTFYQCQWAVLSFNVQGFIEASNEAHELLGRELSQEQRNELLYTGMGDYRDPGVIEGVYEWEHDGRKYVIARIGIGMLAGDARQTEVKEDTSLLVDNVAVGGEGAYTGSYEIFSGTSMAAPAVTGCLAVIAAYEPENASMTDEQLEEAARERAAKLMACVDYDEELAPLCRTGGRVNLHEKTEFTVKAPLISKVEALPEDGSLTVKGWYFGTKGTVAVDDKEIEALSWEDGIIRVDISDISNGSHVVRVTNEDGAVSRAVFGAASESAQGRRLFERSHSLPINEQAFIDNECDRIYDSFTGCGGKIYAFAVTAKNRTLQGIWCYDIEADKWSPCSLPEDLNLMTTCGANQLAALGDRLYMYGTASVPSADGRTGEESCLWRYEPEGDRWEKMRVEMPSSCTGICVLGDMLFAADGQYWPKEESEPEDEFAGLGESSDLGESAAESEIAAEVEGEVPEEDADAQTVEGMKFYKIDPEGEKGIEVSSDMDRSVDGVYAKIAVTNDKIYIYAPYDIGAEAKADQNQTAKGRLIRATYDESQNRFMTEDLTDRLEEALGPDLRTEHDKQNAGDVPAEHFAIAGLGNGLAIIGSGTPGEDIHIIFDEGNEVVLYEKASSYHKAFDPIATSYDGRLYVIGYNTIEPDVMYFRSEPLENLEQSQGNTAQNSPNAAAEEGNTASASEENGPASQSREATDFSRYLGIATIALIVGVALLLAAVRRKK